MIEKVRILRLPVLANILPSNFTACKYSTNNVQQHYDIIITGGGLVGTTLACTLGNINQHLINVLNYHANVI